MKKYTLLWLLLSSHVLTFVAAQELIHFDLNSNNNNLNSVNYLIDCNDTYCFIALYQYSNQFRTTSIVRMDHYGNELGRLSDVSFDGFDIQFISALYEKDNEIIVFANANISGETEFITFSISESFDTYQLIDKIDLGDKYLGTFGFEYDIESDSYETFGLTRRSNNNELLNHFYASIGSDGSINEFEEIEIIDDLSIITAFARIDEEYNYITFDKSNSVVVDGEFNVISDGLQEYPLDLEWFPDSFLIRSYFATAYDGKLVTAGKGAVNTEYASCISIIDIVNDTMVVDTVIGLLGDGIFENIVSINGCQDSEKNIITSSVGFYGGVAGVTPNTLYINKIDQQLQEIWSLNISTDYELISHHVHVTDNATIYIGGNYRGADQIGIRKNFLIIISEQGDIISSNIDIDILDQVTVYPNPTNGELHFDGIANLDTPFEIYNMDGKLISAGKLSDASLAGYPSGIYNIIFDGTNKRIVLHD